ncbi:hypothetical protein ACWGQ5_35430 [Streptomyces sp. NPDC055722]
MTDSTAPAGSGVKMKIRVYAVNGDGKATPPLTTVAVPYDYEPPHEGLSTAFPPCACPIHRAGGKR